MEFVFVTVLLWFSSLGSVWGIPEAEARSQAPQYFIMSRKVSWEKAAAQCQKVTNHQGSLARIETKEQDDEIRKLIRSAAYRKVGENLWTDGKRDEEGTWIWSSTGQTINYINAGLELEPGRGHPAFLTVISPNHVNYEWVVEKDPHEKYAYICQNTK